MLTEEINDLLSRVGPRTPCGELLRRYWHPVTVAMDLTPDKPKRRVRILGEDLVLFRLPAKQTGSVRASYGLVGEQCSHRRASLYYGFVEEDGLRCAYHGWKYALTGECLEQPFEKNPEFRKEVRHKSYPVEELSGLLFACLPGTAGAKAAPAAMGFPGEARLAAQDRSPADPQLQLAPTDGERS